MRLPHACLLLVCWHFDLVGSSVVARGINRDHQKGTAPNLADSQGGESRPRGLSNQAIGAAEIDWYDDDAVPTVPHHSGFVHLGRAGKLPMAGMGGGKSNGMGTGMMSKKPASKCLSLCLLSNTCYNSSRMTS